MKRTLQVGNIISVLFTIAANALVTTNVFNLPDITTVSDMYRTYLNPAGYAFSIWSIIFVALFSLGIYQARDFFTPQENNDLPDKLSGWFIAANVFSGSWTYAFVSGYIGLSVITILALLFCLSTLMYRLRIALDDVSFSRILFVWWPIQIYTGWVAIASVVNVSGFLDSQGVVFSEITATAVLILFSGLISCILWQRNTRLLTLTSTWGIIAVAVRQFSNTSFFAIAAAVLSVVLVLQTAQHAYQNRDTNPLTSISSS